MTNSKYHIINTKDNFKSIYLPELNETYHSVHGAMLEAQHVYIQNGLVYKANKAKTINLLEVGFGTGLNALLTYEYAVKNEMTVSYDTLEPFPIPLDVAKQLEYTNDKKLIEILIKMHKTTFNTEHLLDKKFTFLKTSKTIQKFQAEKMYDLIYYDAFGYHAQPKMWTPSIFQMLYNNMNEGGVLVTYAAKGSFKRTLKAIGFEVEPLDGPKNGKREITRAMKI